ncbi:MAG: hypothetical protein ACFCVG_00825 [Kineosporiaceae bacterium]
MRVTGEEESALVALAHEQRVTVPRLLVEAALAGRGETATQRAQMLAELFRVRRALSQVTVELASSGQVERRPGSVGGSVTEPLWSVQDEIRSALARLDEALNLLGARPDQAAGSRGSPGSAATRARAGSAKAAAKVLSR